VLIQHSSLIVVRPLLLLLGTMLVAKLQELQVVSCRA
jgi:hypothetical protein